MKKIIYSATLVLLLMGCSDDNTKKKPESATENTETTQSVESPITEVNATENTDESEDKPKETEIEEVADEPEIDTSVFDLAKEVKVTDSRDLTQHITLQVILKDGVEQGNGVQRVLTQTYDFLEQEDITGAKTITIFVNSGDLKIFQITIDTSKFKTNDEISMAKLVLEAAQIEKMTDEVKSYGEVLGLW